MKTSVLILATAFGTFLVLTACANRHHEHENQHAQPAHYAPGLGEIMTQTASRHAKLWYAGQARNWALAEYEIDELKEGLEDAGKYHPAHKQISQPIPELMAQYMDQPLAELSRSLAEQNLQHFDTAYDKLTLACNTCHQSTDFGFNVVTRPSTNPFSNQAF